MNILHALETTFASVVTAICNVFTYIMRTIDWIHIQSHKFMESEQGQRILLSAVWTYSQLFITCEMIGKKIYDTLGKTLYDESVILKHITDVWLWTLEQYDLLSSRRKREPISLRWISEYNIYPNTTLDTGVDWYKNDRTTKYMSNERFESYQEHLEPSQEDTFTRMKSHFSSETPHNYSKETDGIVLVRKNDVYYSVLCNRNPNGNEYFGKNSGDPSTVRILSVTYTHPKMTKAIELKIDDGYCRIGNQILSPAFVYRCLEYQEEPFVFDMNYRLDVIDGEINQHVLKSSNYMCIGKDMCGVKTLVPVSLKDTASQ